MFIEAEGISRLQIINNQHVLCIRFHSFASKASNFKANLIRNAETQSISIKCTRKNQFRIMNILLASSLVSQFKTLLCWNEARDFNHKLDERFLRGNKMRKVFHFVAECRVVHNSLRVCQNSTNTFFSSVMWKLFEKASHEEKSFFLLTFPYRSALVVT